MSASIYTVLRKGNVGRSEENTTGLPAHWPQDSKLGVGNRLLANSLFDGVAKALELGANRVLRSFCVFAISSESHEGFFLRLHGYLRSMARTAVSIRSARGRGG